MVFKAPRNLLFILLLIAGCHSSSVDQPTDLDSTSLQETTISEAAKERAIAAKDALFGKLSERLMQVLQTEGPAQAIEVCSREANEIAQIVSQEQQVRIGRTALKLRNENNQPPDWARRLFAQRSTEPQFTNVSADTVGALLPIRLQAKCLICHGPAESLAPDVTMKLAEHYPNDQATGFNEGDLRGWFWVEVPSQVASDGESSPTSDSTD